MPARVPVQKPANKAQLSTLAVKYSHPVGSLHKIIAFTGKSGLTPVGDPLHNFRYGPLSSQRQQQYIDELESYQRSRCFGFTVRELVGLEAFAPVYQEWATEGREQGGYDSEAFGQAMAIHPLFARQKWEQPPAHLGKVPLPAGFNGFWEVQNENVWKILQPCLKLATLYLSDAKSFSWWEALLVGDFEFIEERIPDIWKGGKLVRFRRRRPWVSAANQSEVEIQKEIQAVLGNISYCLKSGWTNIFSGLPQGYDSIKGYGIWDYGVTEVPGYKGRPTTVYISVELLEPLLRGDLNLAERKLDSFRFLTTLLHETAHAIWTQVFHRHGNKSPHPSEAEAYFEDQPIAELGFSMEHAVFGATNRVITETTYPPLHNGLGYPSGALFSHSFFIKQNEAYQNSNAPAIPPFPSDWDYQDSFPIPIGYFEDIYRPEFWLHVRRYGAESAFMGPKTIGSRRNSTVERPIGAYTLDAQVDKLPESRLLVISNAMPPDEQKASHLENIRRQRAYRIHKRVESNMKLRRAARLSQSMSLSSSSSSNPSVIPGETYQPFTDPDLGKDFRGVSKIRTEHGPYQQDSPRYNEILQHLLDNRAQGKLCLDTMDFPIGRDTLYHYIEVYGGISITPEEFKDFLRNCLKNKAPLEYREVGRGMITWLGPSAVSPSSIPARKFNYPPPRPRNLPQPPRGGYRKLSASELQRFRDMCLRSEYVWWWDVHNMDFDIDWLVRQLRIRAAGDWLTVALFKEAVDWHDKQGDLWRWGPNGLARRRWKTWPTPPPPPLPSRPTTGSSGDKSEGIAPMNIPAALVHGSAVPANIVSAISVPGLGVPGKSAPGISSPPNSHQTTCSDQDMDMPDTPALLVGTLGGLTLGTGYHSGGSPQQLEDTNMLDLQSSYSSDSSVDQELQKEMMGLGLVGYL